MLRTEIDVTKTAAANLAADSVLVADAEILMLLALWWFAGAALVRADDDGGHDDRMKRGAAGTYHCRHDWKRFNLEEVGLVVRVRWWVGRGR